MEHQRLIQVANIVGGKGYVKHEQSNRVYSSKGLSPTICSRYDSFMTGWKLLDETNEFEQRERERVSY